MQPSTRIAVIGAGISGLAAAWLLSRNWRVTLFEQDRRPGGHSNTVDVETPTGVVPVDTGFIVYNTASYPNLIALFRHLGVPTAGSDMSFAVSLDGGAYEYSGSGVGGIFGQWRNLLNPTHLSMLAEIRRFFRQAPALLDADRAPANLTLGEYLDRNGYGPAFVDRHILPMAAAIWSAPPARVLAFPAASFVRFFANHGLLQVRGRPEWRTVAGGSRVYVRRVLDDFAGDVALGRGIRALHRDPHGVTVIDTAGTAERFDLCVVATHADDALRLLADADAEERALLGAFAYQRNVAVLHQDARFMPRRRRVWSSWNYRANGARPGEAPTVTYWMNRLQPLATQTNLFVTLNPERTIPANQVRATFDYAHPLFDQAAMNAQPRLWGLQGRRRTWFCGSYFGTGFHEDGLQAGLAVAEDIGGVRRPWTVANESGRIHVGARRAAPRVLEEAAE